MSRDANRYQANSILKSISQSSLTDEEALRLPVEEHTLSIYQALAAILNARGVEGNAIERLNAAAKAAGLKLDAKERAIETSVFVGRSF